MLIIKITALALSVASISANGLYIGNRYTDAQCLSLIDYPISSGDCVATTPKGSFKLARRATCFAYQTENCVGSRRRLDSSLRCHSTKSWGNPKFVKCIVGPGIGGEAVAEGEGEVDGE